MTVIVNIVLKMLTRILRYEADTEYLLIQKLVLFCNNAHKITSDINFQLPLPPFLSAKVGAAKQRIDILW